METIHAVFIISETLYAEPSPVDPIEFLPITDMLIGAAVLFGTVGCVIVFVFYTESGRAEFIGVHPQNYSLHKRKI